MTFQYIIAQIIIHGITKRILTVAKPSYEVMEIMSIFNGIHIDKKV